MKDFQNWKPGDAVPWGKYTTPDHAHVGAEFVREVDNDKSLYLKMLAAPNFRDNQIPDYAREERIAAFLDRIFQQVIARRS